MRFDLTKLILSLFHIGEIKYAPGTLASFLTMILWYFVPNVHFVQLILLLTVLLLSFTL